MSPSRLVQRTHSAGGASLLGFGLLTGLTVLAGGRTTSRSLSPWYEKLEKPPFQPPAWLFGPVWTVLYGLIATSGWRIYRRPPGGQRQRALGLWAAQLALNGLWTWIFFGQRRPRAAFIDILLLLGTIAAYLRTARDVDQTAAKLFVPYAAWVAFATLLNEEIARRNPPREARRLAAGTPP